MHASRRETPGMAEIHTKRYGHHLCAGRRGQLRDRRHRHRPEDDRARMRSAGRSIQGGETRRIVKGDVLIVPNGTPHWFRDVNGPLTYYVVKVTAADGGAK